MPKLKKSSQKRISNEQSEISISLNHYQLHQSTPPPHSHTDDSTPIRQSTGTPSQQSDSQHSHSIIQNSNIINKEFQDTGTAPKHKNTTEKKRNKSKFDADQILRKVQEQCVKHEQDQISKSDDQQTGIYIPENALVGYQDKKNAKKKGKNVIKVKNKFFDAVDFEQSNCQNKKNIPQQEAEELRLLEEEHRNILALRNQKKNSLIEERKNQIELRVDKIRKRLNFSNAYEDIRFKEHIKQTLQNVKDCEEVQIMIEPPKIFKGSSARHSDAALFIKNLSQHQHASQPQVEDSVSKAFEKQNLNNKNKKIDRRQFYQEFTRHLKQTKAIQIPIQTDHLFKKSSLDELQNQFKTHEHLFKEDGNSKLSRHSLNHERSSRNNLDKMRKSIESDKQKLSRESSRSKIDPVDNERTKSIKIRTVEEDASNEDSKMNKQENKMVKYQQNKSKVEQKNVEQKKHEEFPQKSKVLQSQISKQKLKSEKKNKSKNKNSSDPEKIRQKKPKDKLSKNQGRIRKKKNSDSQVDKKIKELFEEEAEDSQNGYGDDGHSSEEGDNSSVQSIIDRKDVKYVLKNEREARRKFMAEQMQKDEEVLRRIKERITEATKIKCEQTSESRRRRRQRIYDAKKKFEDEDQNAEKVEENKQINKQESKQDVSDENDFSKKLQDLEQQILKKKDQKQQKDFKTNGGGVQKRKKSIWQQMNIATSKPESQINQQKRGGFLNNSKAIKGAKIQAPRKSASKKKIINF